MVESRPHQTQIESHWQGSGDNIEFRGTIKYFGGYFYSYFQDLVNIIEFKGIVKYPFYSSICRVLALLQQMRGSVLTGWEPMMSFVKILIIICLQIQIMTSVKIWIMICFTKYKWWYVSKYFLIIQYWHKCQNISNSWNIQKITLTDTLNKHKTQI